MSFQQFSVVMKKEPRVTMGDLMNSFRRIDSIGDGTVSSQELMALLTKVRLKAKRRKCYARCELGYAGIRLKVY